jgi:acetyltransferase
MLEHFFRPKSVAVIGASREPGKVGNVVVRNLKRYGFSGEIYPINPRATEILDLKAYPTVTDVNGSIDLAVIIVPAPVVPKVIAECGEKGIDAAIIISAGFKEAGVEGSRLEREIAETARRFGIRVLGPNCLGLINTITNLNASFAADMPKRGNIGFFSQSGALCTAVMDWAREAEIGFSQFISLGNKMDLSESELLTFLADDDDTTVILGYIEGVKDGAAFLSAAHAAAMKKPVLIFKSGVTGAGARAASSHTGALAGSENAFHAAFKKCGVIRAGSFEELFDAAIAFAYQPLPKGSRLAIITNAGGPGIIAADACERSNLSMATFTTATIEKMRDKLPKTAALYNPVDVIGDAQADRYKVALEAVAEDTNVDMILVILTPQAMTEIETTAHEVASVSMISQKTIATSLMGGYRVESGIRVLAEEQVPNYYSPERAIKALETMARYRAWREQPQPEFARFDVSTNTVAGILEKAKATGQSHLSGASPMDVIAAYGFPVPRSGLADTSDEAVAFAEQFGYPVVMKIASPDILHKSDIGGVRLGLENRDAVAEAFDEVMVNAKRLMPGALILGVTIHEQAPPGKEVILGMTKDPDFGPLIMFGLGGIYVEVLKDVSFRLAPIDKTSALEMIREIRSFPLLRGVRGEPPADIDAVVESILRLSQLVTDFPQIIELDINPLRVMEAGKGAIAIDARVAIEI